MFEHDPDTSGSPSRGTGSSEFDQTREDTVADKRSRSANDAERLPRGTSIGRYVVLNFLGQGGMGVVLAAYDPDLDRKVALKLLRGVSGGTESSAGTRLLREAQALAKLSHPNVVAIHDVGIHEGRVFVAMDFLAGPTFTRWCATNKGKWEEALALYRAAGEGLHAAHTAGLIHRDFKPDNVIIADGRPRVLDFGLARSSAVTKPYPVTTEIPDMRETGPDTSSTSGAGQLLESPVTRLGAIMGTPAYMSPEQHLGEEVGPATDQFSFCVSLYEALHGESPFAGNSAGARALAVTQGEIKPPPKNSEVPSWIFKVLARGMAVDPQDRWPSMRALLDELGTDPVRARRFALSVGGAGLLAVSLLAWGLVRDEEPSCPSPVVALSKADAWSPTIAAQVERAFESTGVNFAEEAARAVVRDLDAYTTRWGRAYTEICEATQVRHELSRAAMDLQMACLNEQRDRLAGWTRSLRAADAGLVENAREARSALPSAEDCRDLDGLNQRVQLPTDATALAAIDEAGKRLGEAAAVQASGDLAKSLEIYDLALQSALASSYAPLLAEVQLSRAQVLDLLGKWDEAASAASAGMVAAEQGRDQRTLAKLRILYASLVGYRKSNTQEGRAWIDLAGVSLQALGGDVRLEARRQSHLGLIFAGAGDYKSELAALAKSLELLESSGSADPIELAGVHNNYAQSLGQHGHFDEALEHGQLALDLWTESLGPHHARTATATASLAVIHDEKGDYKKALELHEKAVQMMEAALGKESPRVDSIRMNLAITAINLGDLARGEATFREVVASSERIFGQDSVQVGKTLGNLGAVLRMQGKYEDSLAVQERAVKIFEAKLGPDHPTATATISGLANAYEKLGRMAEAVELREKVLRLEQKSFGHDAPKIAIGVGNLAWSLLELEGKEARPQRVEELSLLAMDIANKNELGADMEAFLRLVRARALVSQGGKAKLAQARALIDESTALLGDLPATTEREMIETIEGELR